VRQRIFLLALAAHLAGCSFRPWADLRREFASEAQPTQVSVHGKGFVLYSGRMTGAFEYDTGASFDVSQTGVYLSTTCERVFVPVAAIKACSRTEWGSHSDTNLWVEVARVQIALPDNDKVIPQWCTTHNIPIVDKEAADRLRKGS
jgi:hypothetical protein